MQHSHKHTNSTLRNTVAPVAIASLIASVIPLPANAVNEYQRCASNLLTAGVAAESASVACAQALHPQELSECVFYIRKHTPVLAPDALAGCVRVRRPMQLAECVIDINRNTQDAIPTAVLDNCRRSVIPTRFSECVVGLSRQVNLPPSQAMETCNYTYNATTQSSGAIAPTTPPTPQSFPTLPPTTPQTP